MIVKPVKSLNMAQNIIAFSTKNKNNLWTQYRQFRV